MSTNGRLTQPRAGRQSSEHDALAAPLFNPRALMQGLMERHGIHLVEIERAQCMVRDHPVESTRRTTIILRRGSPEQNRNWFAGAGASGPVVIVGMEPWTEVLLDFDRAADMFIEHLKLPERKTEVCLTGGSGGSFAAMMLAAHLAERLPGITVKVVAFSLVAELYHKDETGEHYWPHMIVGLRDRPDTMAGMRRYACVRPHFERAMAAPGSDLRVKAFTTPLSTLDWHQAELIADLACVRTEEVETDDYNHDMMAWTSMPSRDTELSRQKLFQWMKIRNPNWPQRTLETRTDRELAVALEWRQRYPDLASLFTGF